MQKIRFTTVSAGTIEIDDVNISSLTGEKILRLSEFDGNSSKARIDAIKCIDMPGQRVISAIADVKTVMAKIAFAPVYLSENKLVCTGSPGMYNLRREVLKRFPLGETGTLTYINDAGSYEIRARIDEKPAVTVKSGYLCECTRLFSCDYPYWCRSSDSGKSSVVLNSPALITPDSYGDISSPVSGIITCTETLSGLPSGRLEHFVLRDSAYNGRRISFCKALSQGEKLKFCFGYNNEWKVRKSVDGGSTWSDAINYVYFLEWTEPPESNPVNNTRFVFELFESGALDVELSFMNLYTSI